MGLPLLAKGPAAAALTPSSTGKGAKGVPSSSNSAATADAKKPSVKKREVTAADLVPSSSGKGTKGAPTDSSTPEVTDAKTPIEKRHATSLTSDATRATAAAATLASNAQSASAHSDKKTATASQKTVATASSTTKPSVSKSASAKTECASDRPSIASEISGAEQRLARVTAYWAGEGDYYTGRCMSATGVRLHDGHCAVDPNIIPYGSIVEIEGVGKFLAVDTGSAVISRTAAREAGHTLAERSAIVVDVFFEDARDGERFAAGAAKFVHITWWTPHTVASENAAAGGLFAEEDWTKIQGKQL